MQSSDLSGITIHKARKLLDNHELSSVELTQAFLDRIIEVDPLTRAFVTVTSDFAMEQASRADALIASGKSHSLTGIPMQIKDNICTRDIATTCSSEMLKTFIPPYDSTVTSRLYDNGAVLVGKGNLDEFAMGSSTENSAFFSTSKPWDLDRVPGGSSGGPAASVASGECIFAIGSDTGGSIRQPAAFCGVVGLKPSYGLVSRFGLIAFASSLDQIGPLTNDVTDSALVLNVIAGHDYKDSTSLNQNIPDYTRALGSDIRGMRIGVPAEYFGDGIQPEVLESVHEALEVFESLGAVIDRISLPHTSYAMAVYYIIAPSEASANLARYDGVKYGYSAVGADTMWEALEHTRQYGFGEEVKRRIMLGTYALSAGYYDAYYLKAQKVRTLIRNEIDEAFRKCDILVTPSTPSVAFKLGENVDDPLKMYLNDIFTQPANITGIPAISIQGGMADGLPIGLQIMAGRFQEETLLKAAYAYEQETDWHLLRPDL